MFDRLTYSFNQADMKEVRERLQQLPEKYSMHLVPDDMVAIIMALEDFSDIVDDETWTNEYRERALGLRQSILETLNIEEI